MENIFYLTNTKREINGKMYYRITILDMKNLQIFSFYHIADNQTTSFLANRKTFENISNFLTFVIKRNGKISFDIK